MIARIQRWLRERLIASDIETSLAARKLARPARQEAARLGWQTRRAGR